MKTKYLTQEYTAEGFTIIELIMVVSIYTILLLVIVNSIVNLYQTNSYAIAQADEIDEARRGLQSWLQDAREMTFADDGTFPVAVMESHKMGFYSDVDTDDNVEYVEYVLSTTTLNKYTYKSSGYPPVYNMVTPAKIEIMAEFVQNISQSTTTFAYYDSSGGALTSTSSLLTDVRYLEAKVIVNIEPVRSPGEFLLRTSVAPRNLKDNL
jgi:type II secretory pathway pseudopilin PulG